MRKLLVVGLVAAALSTSACAQHHGHHHGGGNWIAPLVIGGVIGAVIANQPRSYTYTPPPPPPVVYYPGTVYPDYTYRPMYKMVDVFFPDCNCYRSVPVQIN